MKHEPRTKFVKVRVNAADILLRKAVAAWLKESESEIDRRLWEAEYQRISNDISSRVR